MIDPSALSGIAEAQLHPEILRTGELSPFFSELLSEAVQQPQLHQSSFGSVDDALSRDALHARYQQLIDLSSSTHQGVAEQLRWLRRHEMIRIIFRDLTRRAETMGTTSELSHLADFCINLALDACYEQAIEKYGQPYCEDGQPAKLVVLGMGKLGAFELNLSSDIDLIFFYSDPGQIDAAKSLTHQEFFLRLARQFIACLDDAGSAHCVFRVDMRLRPYGESGPLVLHRAAMEKYYVEQGRDWERYAFIKARVIAGDHRAGEDFLDWLKPFIYRRHLDFPAIESLREMQGLIARQVALKEVSHDLKLGPGGIREIEFIVQAHQLIWGGRYPALQQRSVLKMLGLLVDLDFIPAEDCVCLTQAYTFLRDSEHVIQAEFDRQTHLLPAGEKSRQRVALAMGFTEYEKYIEALAYHRQQVSRCFATFVSGPRESDTAASETVWQNRWQDPEESVLIDFRQELYARPLDATVTGALDKLMPEVIKAAGGTGEPDLALQRMLLIVRAILRRSTYLAFLNENPEALRRALHLVVVSPWIAEQLERYPILLYELTDRALRDVAVAKSGLQGELREVMRSVDAVDLELQMDALRQFRLGVTIKIAAMELMDQISVMQASDALTALAEVILATVHDLAWMHLEARHGSPTDREGAAIAERMAIIGYGKAGGLELAYGSDLDMVFLCPAYIQGMTDGGRPINNNVFYVRVGQRIIHMLTSFTRFGVLYTADMRLRPQGDKGPLVATIPAFERYQSSEAWTWEHQALIRARFLAGDVSIGEAFARIRRDILTRPRDTQSLRSDVLMMREKMRLQHAGQLSATDGSEILGKFDLKHDAGAIVDIEFMVQYAVLAAAANDPALARWTDVMRLLDELASFGLMSDVDVESLQRAYLSLRAAVHHEWLGLETDYERLRAYRTQVHEIWQSQMTASE